VLRDAGAQRREYLRPRDSMPAPLALDRKTAGATPTLKGGKPSTRDPAPVDENAIVRLHITPFTPALLKSYIAPSILPLATNISYHVVETFPEKGFGYIDLPVMEATKLKKKLNGSTLKGSKVRVEDAKPEKRKAAEGAESEDDKPAKRAKKDRKKKEQGVIEGAELPSDRKIKRGWTEPPVKNRKERKDKDKDKKDKKVKQKDSKYTKEPEMLFKTKLTPVAATEVARKEKSKGKKDKKEKKKSKSKDETIVHEFENNTKQPSFLKRVEVAAEPKPAVEYVNGVGWVDEDGNVVEPETGKARNRRVLELVDSAPVQPTTEQKKPSVTPEAEPSPTPKSKSKPAKKAKKTKKQATPPPSSSESESEESSAVSSSEDEASDSEPESSPGAESSASSPALAEGTPEIALHPSSPEEKKEVHPLEALFKRPKPAPLSSVGPVPNPTSTPVKGLAPINTSFSFFGEDSMEVDGDASGNPPVTPFTQRDLEWRGLRSAAPTPDTAAIGRRFSFPWRKGSQEVDDDDDDDLEAGKQLSNNTKANSSVAHLPGLAEEDENEDEDVQAGAAEDEDEDHEGTNGVEGGEDQEKEESEFSKWFWENRGENNRAWKKRRRETLKSNRLRENKRLRRAG
jgi:hypothetical protein